MSMGMSMGMGMDMSMRQSLTQQLVVSMPPMNWSLLSAFEEEGDKPLRFKKTQLDVGNMTLEERLAVVDQANEVFRFAYTHAEGTDKNGKEVKKYFKIPLMRDYNVEIEDIKIKISKDEYDRATTILNGSGRFQRIARAVPYLQLHSDVKEFVESKGGSLDDVVVVGVDRGGRLPSYIMREALGKSEGYILKVDQAGGGSSGEVDREKLDGLIQDRILQGKFVLFVDSTVDSGRQIEVLKRYFDSEEWKTKIGHKGWGVVGSNEHGQTLYKHKNINWGLNPDESFEDNPTLMGVDYANGSHTKVIDTPTKQSEAIREALLEVPRGTILDFSNIHTLIRIKQAYSHIDKAINSKTWRNASRKRGDLGVVSGLEVQALTHSPTQRKKLLVIGNGLEIDLNKDEIDYITRSLVPIYDVIAGTPKGNPGFVLDSFAKIRQGSSQLYQPRDSSSDYDKKDMFGMPIVFHGESKDEFRENLVETAEAVLVLGGNEGTLRDTILSVHAGKPVYVIKGYGAVGHYATKAEIRHNPLLKLADNLMEAVSGLRTL